jgi:hypothetical protein
MQSRAFQHEQFPALIDPRQIEKRIPHGYTASMPILPRGVSKRLKDRLAFHAFVFCHGAQNGVQSPNAKIPVGRNSKALMGGFQGLQHDVAAFLVDNAIGPIAAKSLHEVVTA